MNKYQRVWLAAHPKRTKEWLAEKIRDGFDVHHADGDHQNDAPDNLVLIESTDHLKLHGMVANRMAGSEAIRQAKAQREREAKEQNFIYGSFCYKTIKGRRYLYFQRTVDRKQLYLGPTTPFLDAMVESFNELKVRSPKGAWDYVKHAFD
jgi:hypothetical protein